jgi:hypothetical protein
MDIQKISRFLISKSLSEGDQMKYLTIVFVLFFVSVSIFAKDEDPNNDYSFHFIASGLLDCLHDRNNCFAKWADDQSQLYFNQIKNQGGEYSNYRMEKNTSSQFDHYYIPLGIGGMCDLYYHNAGIALASSFSIIKMNVEGTNDWKIKNEYNSSKINITYSIYSFIISPSVLYKIDFLKTSTDLVYFRLETGFDFYNLYYFYTVNGPNNEKVPYEDEFTKSYHDYKIGYHAGFGLGYDSGLLAIIGNIRYTHVYFDSIKEKNGSDVMRYSDGRKVSTSIDIVTVSVGAGLHIGW